ncbi:HIT family protein [Candidatus Woesearchaeota archaeon]|nr:HIT family protein [Candidatus Woesearchaeota archaeon]
MKDDSNCIFCKIAKKEMPSEIVYENNNVMAFLDVHPTNPGHTLVIPKKHYRTLLETDDSVLKDMIVAVKKVANAVNEAVGADGINVGINTEKAAGQVIFHTHIHLIPRFERDNLKPWPQKEYKEGQAENIKKEIIKQLK